VTWPRQRSFDAWRGDLKHVRLIAHCLGTVELLRQQRRQPRNLIEGDPTVTVDENPHKAAMPGWLHLDSLKVIAFVVDQRDQSTFHPFGDC
jgi:hypothetical protein